MLKTIWNKLTGRKAEAAAASFSVAVIADLLIQVCYSFDSDATTQTDWGYVMVLASGVVATVLAALGFQKGGDE